MRRKSAILLFILFATELFFSTFVGPVVAGWTWDSSTKRTLTQTSEQGPAIAYHTGLNKMFMAFWSNGPRILVMSSSDMLTWDAPVDTGSGAAGDPDMTYNSDETYLYLTYRTLDHADPTGVQFFDLWVKKSSNGIDWTNPVLVVDGAFQALGPSITYDTVNHRLLHATVMPGSEVAYNVWLQQSTDNGQTWTVLNDGYPVQCGGSYIAMYNEISLRFLNGGLFIAYRGSGGRLHVIRSVDGISWNNCSELSETANAHPSITYNPSESRYHLMWSGTDSDSHMNDILSPDGVTWSGKFTFEQTEKAPSVAFNSGSNVLTVAWLGREWFDKHLNVEQYNGFGNPFTMSTFPSTVDFFCSVYDCDFPTKGSTLTIRSLSGFSGTITLSYVAPNPAGGTLVTGPSSVYLPSGGSISVTLIAYRGSQSGSYAWIIQGQGGSSTVTTTLTIDQFICSRPPCPTGPQNLAVTSVNGP